MHRFHYITISLVFVAGKMLASEPPADHRFNPIDIFQLEYASDPQISPDGKQVAYVRNSMDIMKDRQRTKLWIVNTDGSDHTPVTSGETDESSPRWSPDGKRLIYISKHEESSDIFCRWMETGQSAKLTQMEKEPSVRPEQ